MIFSELKHSQQLLKNPLKIQHRIKICHTERLNILLHFLFPCIPKKILRYKCIPVH